MTPALLHRKLVQACEKGNLQEVKEALEAGVDPNFEFKSPINALSSAVQNDEHEIIELLLAHGACVKALVLQKAIEKNRDYLALLLPNFKSCQDEELLMGVLHAAINTDDLALVKEAIKQGAKPASLFLYAIRDFGSTGILQLLIENGFDIHVNKNMLLTEWIGSCLINEWGRNRSSRKDFLVFISDYYLEKPKEIEKFKSWRASDKFRLFRMGMTSNNTKMMKFSILIGCDRNQALNTMLQHHYLYKEGKGEEVDYTIIEYLLSLKIVFKKITLSNAVCFNYVEILNVLTQMQDLEYAYEMAYKYEKEEWCDFFIQKGVSKASQSIAQMKVSALKGDTKTLRNAINNGADLKAIDKIILREILNKNQIDSLKILYEAGVVFDRSLNTSLDHAMNYHKAYESISFLVEVGFDITHVKLMPLGYKAQYPTFFDMWEKRFSDIFNYTIYLAKEVYPRVEGKEKEEILQQVAAFSALPYVVKKSEEKSRGA